MRMTRMLPGMRSVRKWSTGLLLALCLCLGAFMVEPGFGHDGLLCELGYDKDGDGTGVSGCG